MLGSRPAPRYHEFPGAHHLKAIVHIGTEKTGTSSIQRFLQQNRRKLRKAGFHVLESAGKGNSRILPAYCIGDERFDDFFYSQQIETLEARNAYKAGFLARFEQELEALPPSVHTVIISSEHFHSRIRTEEEMGNVHRLLSRYFDPIRIVCYLREQVTTCTSHYSTSLKAGRTSGFVEFMARCTPANYYYNYVDMLANWERGFGNEALDVALFDRDRFLNNDLLDDFTARIAPELVGTLNKNIEVANESLSPAGQALALGVNRAFPIRTLRTEVGPLREKCIDLIYRRLKGRGQQLSLEHQRTLFEAFAESNELLRRKYFPHDEKLFGLPTAEPSMGFELDDTFTGTLLEVLKVIKKEARGLLDAEEYSNACLQVISSTMDTAPREDPDAGDSRALRLTEGDARLLVQAATLLEKRDLEISLDLVNLALKIGPQLPRASAKQAEYRERLESKTETRKFLVRYCLEKELDDAQNRELGPRWAEWLKTLETAEGSYVKRLESTRRISPDGTVEDEHGDAPMIYTVIQAASLDEAIEQARQCPFLDFGVAVEVSTITGIVGRRG